MGFPFLSVDKSVFYLYYNDLSAENQEKLIYNTETASSFLLAPFPY